MKIANSNISMASTHVYSQNLSTKSVVSSRMTGIKGNNLDFYQNFLKNPLQEISKPEAVKPSRRDSIMSIKLQLIHRIFDAIAGRHRLSNPEEAQMTDESGASLAGSMGFNVWERVSTRTTTFSESEATTFQTTGSVLTEDGRSIDFGIELSMSRSFTAVYEEYEQVQYMVTDPLIINIDSDITSVSDMKFFFDLDADGTEEEISFAGAGSGFLALDINGDGVINDGSELFGTKSGDGFADLAKYDKDHNGWIDENDKIFDMLKVWTKDEDGKDQLIDLKAAGVGAIYLGSSKTQFSLTDENNYVNAYIRSTGMFLRENGGVGTIAQVDLTS